MLEGDLKYGANRSDSTVSPKLGEHRTLAEKAFISLHRAIVSGELSPGARIPLDELARMLDMSAMPVREAVRRLSSMGLVENVPHKGARIAELSIEDLIEVYEARLVLEPLAVYRGAMAFTEMDEVVARRALDVMSVGPETLTDVTEHWSAHSTFHLGLYEAAGSNWLMRLIRPLWDSSERYRLATPLERGVAARRDEHEKVLEACVDHAGGLAAGMLYNHLASTANSTSKAMGGGDLFLLLSDEVYVPPVDFAASSVPGRRGTGVGRATV